MNEEKKEIKGLVLGGGGAKGCYEIGAWQAFNDCQIYFDVVSGTSIGAIVGALYTQQSLQGALDFVHTLKPTSIAKDMFYFPEDLNQAYENRDEILNFLNKYKNTGLDITPLKEGLERVFDYEKFRSSPINFACVTLNVTKFRPEVFFKDQMTKEDALSIILASASCFPAFPMMNINGENFIDGGMDNNVPWDLAVEMKANDLVIINVHGPGREKPIPDTVKYMLIQPIVPLGNFLDFSNAEGMRSLRLGYLETMKYLSKFPGYYYTFSSKEWPAIFVCERFISLYFEKIHIMPSLHAYKKALVYILGFHPAELTNKYQRDYGVGYLIEALAVMADVDPANLYEYRFFLDQVSEVLSKKTIMIKTSNLDLWDVLKTSKRAEVVMLLHQAIADNQGKLPLLLDPAKTLFESAYLLAETWYYLDLYVNRKK